MRAGLSPQAGRGERKMAARLAMIMPLAQNFPSS
jgi:hypothetical protein